MSTIESRLVPPVEEVPACPLCGSTSDRFLFATSDRLHRLPGAFGLVECSDCRLIRLSPRPRIEDLGYYYPSDYYSFASPVTTPHGSHGPDGPSGDEAAAGPRAHLRNAVLASKGYRRASDLPPLYRATRHVTARVLRRRVFFDHPGVPDWKEGGRVLDVGCGAGGFMRFLRYHGWEVHGVELDELAAARAQESLPGSTVFAGEITDAPFEPGTFDVVHLSHVVEHMADPVASLRAARRLLRDGGEIFVETPNARSWNFRRMRERWFAIESPRHLYLFDPQTLTTALAEAGLRPVRIRTTLDPLAYRFEDAYVREEAGEPVIDPPEQRLRVRARRRPRAAALWFGARVQRRLDHLSGDNLLCWARAAGED